MNRMHCPPNLQWELKMLTGLTKYSLNAISGQVGSILGDNRRIQFSGKVISLRKVFCEIWFAHPHPFSFKGANVAAINPVNSRSACDSTMSLWNYSKSVQCNQHSPSWSRSVKSSVWKSTLNNFIGIALIPWIRIRKQESFGIRFIDY